MQATSQAAERLPLTRPPSACAGSQPLVTVVLNPAAGRGSARRAAEQITGLLNRASGATRARWRIEETRGPGEARQLAAEAAASGARVVAAAGGDGTVGEVVNGIMGTGAALGIIPLGTGNDVARCLGLTGPLDRAVDALFCGRTRPIDAGTVAGRWFVNIAGCGFDAAVADRVNRGVRFLHGTAAYVAAILQCLISYRASRVHIAADDLTIDLDALLCSVANTPSYGGGMRVAPNALVDDGLFDVVIVGQTGRIDFLLTLPRVFRGAHINHPKVTTLRGARITVEADPPVRVLVDGEVVGTTPAEFVMSRHALQVMVPADEGTGT